MKAFRVVENFDMSGFTYTPKHQKVLYNIFSNSPFLFQDAIEKGLIRPFNKDDEWYVGPHKEVLWRQNIYLVSEVREAMAGSGNRYYLGTKRKHAITTYLETLNS